MFKRADWDRVKEVEQRFDQARSSYERNREIFDGLYRQAKKLGLFPSANPLEGVEKDISVARILNAIRRAN